jgi:hypothetical protein
MTPGNKGSATPQGQPDCSASHEVLSDLPDQALFRHSMLETLRKVQHKVSVSCSVFELKLFLHSYTRTINQMCIGRGKSRLCETVRQWRVMKELMTVSMCVSMSGACLQLSAVQCFSHLCTGELLRLLSNHARCMLLNNMHVYVKSSLTLWIRKYPDCIFAFR